MKIILQLLPAIFFLLLNYIHFSNGVKIFLKSSSKIALFISCCRVFSDLRGKLNARIRLFSYLPFLWLESHDHQTEESAYTFRSVSLCTKWICTSLSEKWKNSANTSVHHYFNLKVWEFFFYSIRVTLLKQKLNLVQHLPLISPFFMDFGDAHCWIHSVSTISKEFFLKNQ